MACAANTLRKMREHPEIHGKMELTDKFIFGVKVLSLFVAFP